MCFRKVSVKFQVRQMRGCKRDFNLRLISSTLNLNPSLHRRSCKTFLSFPIYPSLTYNRTGMFRSKELHCLFFARQYFRTFERLQVSLRYGLFTKQLKIEFVLFSDQFSTAAAKMIHGSCLHFEGMMFHRERKCLPMLFRFR